MTRRTFNQVVSQRILDVDSPGSLYDMGEYAICLSFLGKTQVSLRLKCLLRLGRYSEIVRSDVLQQVQRLPRADQLDALAFIATAYFRLRMVSAADAAFNNAYAIADDLGLSNERRADLYYYDALRKWSMQEYSAAEALLDRIESVPGNLQRCLEARSWIAAGRDGLEKQFELLAQSTDAVGDDAWHRATAIRTYADLVSEMCSEEHYQRAVHHITNFDWSTDMSEHRFVAYRSLAIAAMYAGRTHKAVEFLCEAEASATTPARLCELVATRAEIARRSNDENSAREYRIEAMALSDLVSWANESDFRVALLILAQEHYRADEFVSGDRAISLYRSIKTPISPSLAHGLNDQRLYAMEQYAAGFEHLAHNRRDEARCAFTESLKIFRSIGYHARAIRAATQLGRITNRSDFLDYAAVELRRRFPYTPICEPVIVDHLRRCGCPEFEALSDTKKGIILGIADGLTEKEIAINLSTSHNNVRNRIAELYDQFTPQKRNRSSLIHALRDRGIL